MLSAGHRIGLRNALAAFVLVAAGGCESLPELDDVLATVGSGELTTETIARGLAEALEVGAGRTVDVLGVEDGFLASPYRIALPQVLQDARDVARPFGFADVFDDLEQRLNRAAEVAAPKARRLFVNAIRGMTFDDVMGVYRGPDDAATRYLEQATSSELGREMRPIVDASLADVGALSVYRTLVDRYNRLPLVTRVNTDLTGYVVDRASDALFDRLAIEEAAIRNDPVKRSTELLRRVFSDG